MQRNGPPTTVSSLPTIVALASGSLDGGVAIVRLSGAKALSITQQLFFTAVDGQRLPLQRPTPRHMHYGQLWIENSRIDDPLMVYFPAPHSYTGEDVVELYCHAGPYIVQTIIRGCLSLGAWMASPGEFTQRAFLHGKMDLSQAEALPDLLAALTPQQHALAQGQLQGAIAREIAPLKEHLLQLLSLLELELDFSDQDVEFADRGAITELLERIEGRVRRLTESYARGQIVRRGVRVALMGAPNAGKSTLFNDLLGYDRAIVTPVAGTTRDTIEATLSLGGQAIVLIDTAGLRETDETVEREGIRRSIEALSGADAFLLLVAADALPQDPSLAEVHLRKEQASIRELCASDKPGITLLSRYDLSSAGKPSTSPSVEYLPYSSLQPETLQGVIRWIERTARRFAPRENEMLLTNPRHYGLLQEALAEIALLHTALSAGEYPEILAHHIRRIQQALAAITGTITTEDVLGNIFKNFCIGK